MGVKKNRSGAGSPPEICVALHFSTFKNNYTHYVSWAIIFALAREDNRVRSNLLHLQFMRCW